MKENKIHVIFVYFAIIFGTLFIFLTPPFQSPDEDSHFKKAYTVSRARLFKKSANGVVGYYLPNEMVNYIADKNSKMSHREWKYTYEQLYGDNFLPADYTRESVYNFSTQDMTIIPYLPSAIGIFIARHTSAVFIGGECSAAYMLYFARFFNLIMYCILGAFAIKFTPLLKNTIAVILLFPMSLFLGSMVTYDSIIIPFVMLTFGLILRLIYDKKTKFDLKYIIFFCFAGYLLIKIKIVYSLILGLLFAVPKNKFKDNKKWKYALILIGSIALLYILSRIPDLLSSITVTSGDSELVVQQKTFIRNNPIMFIKIILKNMYMQRIVMLCQTIGILGLLDTYIPRVIILLLFALLLIVSFAEMSMNKIKVNKYLKIVIAAIFFIICFAVYAGMYIIWTPIILKPAGVDVTGVQGRYFLPIIVLPFIVLSNNWFKNNEIAKKVLNAILEHYYLVIAIGLICSTLMLLFRYWC